MCPAACASSQPLWVTEAILECVNSLLASGEVPGLYTHEELEPLLAPLKEHMGDAGFQFRTCVPVSPARLLLQVPVHQ